MQEEDLFESALQCSAEDLGGLLDRHCTGRPELRQRIERLLEAHRQSNALDLPVAPTQVADAGFAKGWGSDNSGRRPASATVWVEERIGDTIGLFTLERRLGEGGMGSVWVAKQTEPVKRRVALKLIKVGMDSREVISRFEHERQALAVMDHPNIARVIDAGLTAKGHPFFAMELVNGLPLTQFCDEAKLSTAERLEVFIQICSAVQHAHQKGIIHRDLKPANILVTMIDGNPIPKVIDFGVSKALSGTNLDRTLSTQFGAVIGTLEYMAPEQAGYSGSDVDTRSDIYALGVILYELLTGLRPFDSQRLRKAALHEVMRIIREEEPTKPSTRLSTAESLPSLAAARRSDPRKLARSLRGDLDWIALKCLEKDRGRRYETANQLSLEIRRFLSDEPVTAGRPSSFYLARKFARRHRLQVVTSLAMVSALIVGLLLSLQQMQVARANREIAQTAADTEILERQRAEQAQIDAEAARLEVEQKELLALESHRQVRSALDVVTDDLVNGVFAKSAALTADEQEFLRKLLGFYDDLTKLDGESSEALRLKAQAYVKIANLQGRGGAATDALQAFAKMRETIERIPINDPDSFEDRYLVAVGVCMASEVIHNNSGSAEEIRDMHAEARRILDQLYRENSGHSGPRFWLGWLEMNEAVILLEEDNPSQAIAKFKNSLRYYDELILEQPSDYGAWSMYVGNASAIISGLRATGKSAEANDMIEQTLVKVEGSGILESGMAQRQLAEVSAGCVNLCIARGELWAEAGDFAEAITACERAIRIIKAASLRDPADRSMSESGIYVRHLHGKYLIRQNRIAEGLQKLRDAEAVGYADLQESGESASIAQRILWIQGDLAYECANDRRTDEAIGVRLREIELRESSLDILTSRAEQLQNLAATRESLAYMRASLGQSLEAIAEFRRALTVREQLVAEFRDDPKHRLGLAKLRLPLILQLIHSGDHSQGMVETMIAKAELISLVASHPAQSGYEEELGNLLQTAGQAMWDRQHLAESLQLLDEAIDVRRRVVEREPDLVKSRIDLARTRASRMAIYLNEFRVSEAVSELQGVAALMTDETAEEVELLNQCEDRLDRFGEAQRNQGNSTLALALFQHVAEIRDSRASAAEATSLDHNRASWSHFIMALSLIDLKKADLAVNEFRQIVALQERQAGKYPAQTELRHELIHLIYDAGRLLRQAGNYSSSIEMFDSSLRASKSLQGDLITGVAAREAISGRIVRQQAHISFHRCVSQLLVDDQAGAIDSIDEAVRSMEQWLALDPANRQNVVFFDQDFRECLESLYRAKFVDGISLTILSYLETGQRFRPADIPLDVRILSTAGLGLLEGKRYEEAERVLRLNVELRRQQFAGHWETYLAESWLGGALMGMGERDEAAPLLQHGYEELLSRQGSIPIFKRFHVIQAAERMLQFADGSGDSAQMERWQAEVDRLKGLGGSNVNANQTLIEEGMENGDMENEDPEGEKTEDDAKIPIPDDDGQADGIDFHSRISP